MNLSYWEQRIWFSNVDFCIVGSGIVGLSCALQLKKRHPKAKIIVLEKGILPQGASTKNAGFACFGSASELLSDLKNHSEEEVVNLVKQRIDGLELLKSTLGEKQIDYQQNGGYEVFLKKDKALFEECKANLNRLNKLLKPVFKADFFQLKTNSFGFKNTLEQLIFNPFEGQIDTGKMMQTLLQKVQSQGVFVLNSVKVKSFSTEAEAVHIQLNNFSFKTKHFYIATNAFASELLNLEVTPARNQVLITQPIPNLHIKGTFHLDEGFYYFRNIHHRILLGGGRNLDEVGETTSVLATTERIQNALENLLHQVILPDQQVDIDQRWSGILGVGNQKKPIVKTVENRVRCAVRLGGMGVAIGSNIGKELANLID
ncbi:NAD(P)/FAD-dependent oxidoreductase [Psychroflexus planctonicus]|uniref:FAD-dependent oxidoreductase n=1 Tax=Psychroflexus planctonicus TaxID=1526575 RepID=A0ABQ1SF56_9FLAO|nr:FAD-dependent oxidoreductase [Psychroflexus planctonicus]GGE35730.1 FAD-dependent oxidoreductase [Psychroflexus planctonicus]